MTDLSFHILIRLLLAVLLGGLIGLNRELRRKPAGLRTNMYICLGSTMFTILSQEVAIRFGNPSDGLRIAAQIVTGIGFLGAGAIIRDRGEVLGMTTAAAIFVNASIGMAVGAGMYTTAIFATLLVLASLTLFEWVENHVLRRRLTIFRLTAADPEHPMRAANAALADIGVGMQQFQIYHVGDSFVMQFEAEVTRSQQEGLLAALGPFAATSEPVSRDARD